jgi:hypothetical protein
MEQQNNPRGGDGRMEYINDSNDHSSESSESSESDDSDSPTQFAERNIIIRARPNNYDPQRNI